MCHDIVKTKQVRSAPLNYIKLNVDFKYAHRHCYQGHLHLCLTVSNTGEAEEWR